MDKFNKWKHEDLICFLGALVVAALIMSGIVLALFAHPSKTHAMTIEQVVQGVNAARVKKGEPALVENPILDKAAQERANYLVSENYFAHEQAGKRSWSLFFPTSSFAYEPRSHYGENLARYTGSYDVIYGWMHSAPHKANILDTSYNQTGIGIATGTYDGRKGTYIVQFFATGK